MTKQPIKPGSTLSIIIIFFKLLKLFKLLSFLISNKFAVIEKSVMKFGIEVFCSKIKKSFSPVIIEGRLIRFVAKNLVVFQC